MWVLECNEAKDLGNLDFSDACLPTAQDIPGEYLLFSFLPAVRNSGQLRCLSGGWDILAFPDAYDYAAAINLWRKSLGFFVLRRMYPYSGM